MDSTLKRLFSKNKTTLLSGLGAGLEYYDFVIYILLAHYINLALFPKDNHLSILGTLSIFSAGYLIRPMGGLILGSLGDKYGRKKIFLLSIGLMAFSTLSIGLIPNYDHIGFWAPLLLLSCRLLQGFSLGAEIPGAITFLIEHVGSKYRGTHCGFLFLNIGFGALLSSLISYLLTAYLSTEQMLSWGFRIPFFLGGALAIVCFYLRKNVAETPVFLQQKPLKQSPLRHLLTHNMKEVILGIGITFFGACFIIYALYLPTYLHHYFGYPLKTTYLASTLSLIWGSLCLLGFGWLSDKIGRSMLMYMASIVVVFLVYALFYMVSYQSTPLLFLFMLLYQTIVAALAACYPTMLAELFPTRTRYSGVALCYNVSFSLASFTPLATAAFILYTKQPLLVSLLFSSLAMVTLIATVFIDDKTKQPLPEDK